MSDYNKPLPKIDESNQPYWDGLKQHKVVLFCCGACGDFRMQSSRYCPRCGSEDAQRKAVSGRGHVWARCAFHHVYFEGFKNELPYNVVVIELEEGPRLYTNLVGVSSVFDVPIDTAVEAYFDDVTPEVTLLKFQPAV